MNPLQTRLAALRRHLRLVVTVRGACLGIAVLVGGLFVAGLIDLVVYRLVGIETWPLLRAGWLAATMVVAGAIFYLLLVRPLATRTDDLSLALRVEEQYPILNDALASTVQFLDPRGTPCPGTSPSLQQEAVQRAMRLAQGCDFNKAVNPRGVRLSAAALAAVMALVVPLVMLRPAEAWTALARVTDPFGQHHWAVKTEIDVEYPHFLAIGQPLTITGKVRGLVPEKLEIEFDDPSTPRRQADIKEHPKGQGAFVVAGIRAPSHRREIGFRVWAGNAVSPKESGDWHKVALRQPPQLAALNGKPSPQIVVRQPRYTGLPEYLTLPDGSGNLDVVAGSQVTLRAATDQPIRHAWVEFKPLWPGAREGLLLSGLGPRQPVDALTTVELANSVWGRIPGMVQADGKAFSVSFVPGLTGAYILTVQDKDGLSKSYEFDLHVRADPVPVVSLVRPSTSQSVLANAEITLQILAEDEFYALRRVFLEYRRKDKHGRWVDSEPRRLLFYDHAKAEHGLPQVLSAFAAAPLPLPAMPLHLRPKQLVITQRWSLRGLAVEGETLVIQACAADFNDVVAFPQIGRSHEIELKIVGRSALAGVFDEREVELQQQLLKLRAMQERAIQIVIGAEQQWRATGKLRPEDLVELAEAEQIQKDIQARVGAKKDEGLRGDLAQLEELAKDNKLTKSEVAERIKTIRQELDRLSRDNLPKIEPDLNKARRELEAPEPPRPPDAKERGDLGSARAQQEKVHQTLNDLLKLLEEQSTFQQLKGELRAILQEQQERQKEVENLLDATAPPGGMAALRDSPQLKGELRRTAELQRRLATRAEKLLDGLDELSKKMAAKDPGLADMLDRAVKIGKDEWLPDAMRAVAKQLADKFDVRQPAPKANKQDGPLLNNAHRSQGNVIEILEKMLDTLDQTRADEVERLIVRQKQEEKGLKDLAAQMAGLQEKIDAARKIANPLEREAALKKLGAELRKLQTDAENNARAMARSPQAKEAANDLKDAAKKMERVLRQLERGEEPDEALKPAQDKIDEARDKLEEARAIAEEELSREQIAKIVDRLKGLKEREDAILAESERLRKEFQTRSNWTDGTVQSLVDMKAAQEGLAGETALFKDKLKGAKVFHTLLDRSQQDMIVATAKAKDWLRQANQHSKLKTLSAAQFADETRLHAATAQAQKSASYRLQRLIDALLPELEAPLQDPQQENPKEGGGPGGADPKKKGGIAAQDGIPATAQLKALMAEQLEVNALTKEFAEHHPDFAKLSPAELAELNAIRSRQAAIPMVGIVVNLERAELDAIRAEQDRLLQLFRELITSAQAEGDRK